MQNILFLLICASVFILLESKHATKIPKTRNPRSPLPDKDSGLFGDLEEATNIESLQSPTTNNKTVGFLPLPPGYNKLVIPLGNVSTSIFIMIHLSIREILDVDTSNGILEMDTELGITWIDWEVWKYFIEDKEARKNAENGPEEITLDAEFLKHIWKPDIFIEEMASVERTSLIAKLITLKFLVKNEVMPGAITFVARQTFKVRCDMDFQYYPADTQKCQLNMRSYSYPEDKLFLVWNPTQRVFLDQIEDPNYDLQVSDVEPGEELYDLFTTSQATCCTPRNYSTLSFTIQLRRNLTYHLVQTCLPSVLLVLITWLCFLLPPDMVEVRIGISMTTLLTLTAMFAAVREQAPDVAYAMAIDIWMVFCIFLLFLALVLFTFIYWVRRRLGKKTDDKVESPNTDDPSEDIKMKDHKCLRLIGFEKKNTFILFAILFLIFLGCFSWWLMSNSKYYDWDPSPQYNAIPLEDGDDSNKLFTRQEKKFKPNTKKKVVESEFRFRDLFRDVISPRITELEGGSQDYYEEEEEEVETTTLEVLTNVTDLIELMASNNSSNNSSSGE